MRRLRSRWGSLMRGKARGGKAHRPEPGHPWGYGKQVKGDCERDKNEDRKENREIVEKVNKRKCGTKNERQN